MFCWDMFGPIGQQHLLTNHKFEVEIDYLVLCKPQCSNYNLRLEQPITDLATNAILTVFNRPSKQHFLVFSAIMAASCVSLGDRYLGTRMTVLSAL